MQAFSHADRRRSPASNLLECTTCRAGDELRDAVYIDTGDRSQLTLFKPFAEANDFFHFATVRNALTGYGIGGPLYADLLRATLQGFGTT